MATVIFDITMSLDGFVAGPDANPDQPLGAEGEKLHEWAYDLASWREPHGLEGGEVNADNEIFAEAMRDVRAYVMGRGMFGGATAPGGTSPGRAGGATIRPSTRRSSSSPTMRVSRCEKDGGTTFHFVTDGIEAGVARASETAGGGRVLVAGGADVAQQALRAGLVDEMQIHVAPLLLGGGVRLFDDLGPGIGVELRTDGLVTEGDASQVPDREVRPAAT